LVEDEILPRKIVLLDLAQDGLSHRINKSRKGLIVALRALLLPVTLKYGGLVANESH